MVDVVGEQVRSASWRRRRRLHPGRIGTVGWCDQPRMRELPNTFRRAQVFEHVRTEVAQTGARRQLSLSQSGGSARNEHLAALG